MSFDSLGLSESLLKAIAKKGYTEPSAIQEKAIPHVLARRDVIASAQTGTGKTAGFVLPMLDVLKRTEQPGRKVIRGLVLTPTRELAAQIQENVVDYSCFMDTQSTVIFGGVGQGPQVAKIKKGIDILIATPGRLLDLEGQGLLDLSKVQILVLDEADRMLDMGFMRDIKRILALLPDRRQNLLFSATFNKEIKKLANSLLYNPIQVEATPENTTAELVEHKMYRVDKSRKSDLLVQFIKEGDWSQVLVFTRTKHGANRLSRKLDKSKIKSAAIHGDKSQGARTKALAGFKAGEVKILVATDIAARGLDIPQLPLVVNYELPNVPEDYVHRIGRTGRAGATGEAISFVSLDEVEYMKDIEKLLGQEISKDVVEGYEPTETQADIKAREEAAKERKRQFQRNRSSRPKNSRGGGQRKGGGNQNKSQNKSRRRGRG